MIRMMALFNCGIIKLEFLDTRSVDIGGTALQWANYFGYFI